MSPWRHPPPEPERDSVHVAATLFLAALALLAGLVLAGGCAPVLQCPIGTFPTTTTAEQETSGAGQVGVPTASGAARFSSEARAATKCARVCQAGQLLKASQDDKRVSVECLAVTAPAK